MKKNAKTRPLIGPMELEKKRSWNLHPVVEISIMVYEPNVQLIYSSQLMRTNDRKYERSEYPQTTASAPLALGEVDSSTS